MPVKKFFDTNILLYAYDLDAGSKRETALELVSAAFADPDNMAVSVPVLQEFHVNFVKAGRAPEEADQLIQDFSVFKVIDNTFPLLQTGLAHRSRWQLSLWDAMILAAAHKSGARELYSEDFNTGQDYGGIRAVNPFAPLP